MRYKFLYPPARTSFLSMLLLFPYFLCCPPSPPCRAALHAGACWPWRPTRYCQPSFHAPFCGLKIFLRKGAPLHERCNPSLPPTPSLASASPCSIFPDFTLITPEIIKIVSVPTFCANTWDWINRLATVYSFSFVHTSSSFFIWNAKEAIHVFGLNHFSFVHLRCTKILLSRLICECQSSA